LKAGDSAIDVVEGINADCGVTIGVLSGAQNREQILPAKPTLILDSLADIRAFLDDE
jgi:phosphoglycolate phosphatase-like HAD superfamily hydrolase